MVKGMEDEDIGDGKQEGRERRKVEGRYVKYYGNMITKASLKNQWRDDQTRAAKAGKRLAENG